MLALFMISFVILQYLVDEDLKIVEVGFYLFSIIVVTPRLTSAAGETAKLLGEITARSRAGFKWCIIVNKKLRKVHKCGLLVCVVLTKKNSSFLMSSYSFF